MDKLYPYQEVLLDRMQSGFKAGEMMIMSSGRQTGKSMFTAAALKRLLDDLHNQPVTDLVMSEGKVYGARYMCVQPIGGNWLDMEKWCHETFGTHGGAIWGQDPKRLPLPNERWYMNNRKFWFRNEKDRVQFVLRWGP